MHRRLIGLSMSVVLSLGARALADTCTTTPWDGMAGVPPLTDFPPGYLYLGLYEGFLYEGSNLVPADHDADGRALAAGIVPRDVAGNACANPGPDCRILFLSIGFSNNTIEFCGGQGIGGDADDPSATPCPLPTARPPYLQPESFIAQALADPGVEHAAVTLVDGAQGGATYSDWDPTVSGFGQYQRVLSQILAPSNLSAAQVQAIWVKDAEARPTVSLAAGGPGNPPDAIVAERHLGNIMRALKTVFPNVRQVFVSPRIYGGYANTAVPPNDLNPEPYAYEIGFSIKWLIDSQIRQARGEPPDPNAGDLDYRSQTAPWIAWGPYLWANGTTPRSDGLVWLNTDLRGTSTNECTHPSVHGEQKVASMLLTFTKTTPYTNWFLAPPRACGVVPDSLQLAADGTTLSWTNSGAVGTFDVARGNVRALHTSSGDFGSALCLRNDLLAPSTIDTDLPPLGTAGYYLVRCDGGTWNDGSQQGDRDTTLLSCP